jgi:hypothetical protein
MAAEPYTRIVVDATGQITDICHLDFESQYQDKAFTRDGCANADMARDEYEAAIAAAVVEQSIATAPASSTATVDSGTPPEDQPAPFQADQLFRSKALLQLAQSKLVADPFVSALQAKIDDIDAELIAGGAE